MSDFKRMPNDEKYSRIGLNIAYQRKLKKLHKYNLQNFRELAELI